MKRLLLMRHAEAAWESNGQTDFERPLTPGGESDAIAGGCEVVGLKCLPDAIITSPAKRAYRTAELFVEGVGIDVEIRTDKRIYEATLENLCEIVAELGASVQTLMLVGHNPGLEALVAYLTDSLTPMHPGATAVVDLQIMRWGDLCQNSGCIAALVQPASRLTYR